MKLWTPQTLDHDGGGKQAKFESTRILILAAKLSTFIHTIKKNPKEI